MHETQSPCSSSPWGTQLPYAHPPAKGTWVILVPSLHKWEGAVMAHTHILCSPAGREVEKRHLFAEVLNIDLRPIGQKQDLQNFPRGNKGAPQWKLRVKKARGCDHKSCCDAGCIPWFVQLRIPIFSLPGQYLNYQSLYKRFPQFFSSKDLCNWSQASLCFM